MYKKTDFFDDKSTPQFFEKILSTRRIAKGATGGRRFRFSVFVAIGDKQGRVGIGDAKAKEIGDAIKKATSQAKKKLIKICTKQGHTISHDIIGKHGATTVLLRQAPQGTGMITNWCIKEVLLLAGLQNIVCKCIGRTKSVRNVIYALLDGFNKLESPREIYARRGLIYNNTNNHAKQISKNSSEQDDAAVKNKNANKKENKINE